jgi:cytochrome oxidase Cu insertion factor (SCO1/SenC/PrrC family)
MQVLARRRRGVACLVLSLAAGFLARPTAAQAPAPEALKLRVGDTAPDFKLQYFDGHDLKDVNLSDYRGKKNVVLAFYIFAFTGG